MNSYRQQARDISKTCKHAHLCIGCPVSRQLRPKSDVFEFPHPVSHDCVNLCISHYAIMLKEFDESDEEYKKLVEPGFFLSKNHFSLNSSLGIQESDSLDRRCRQCGQRGMNVALLPCRHIGLCDVCVSPCRYCPFCSQEIEFTMTWE
jgi:hypothetical protein